MSNISIIQPLLYRCPLPQHIYIKKLLSAFLEKRILWMAKQWILLAGFLDFFAETNSDQTHFQII